MKRIAQLLAASGFLLTGCNADSPMQADSHHSHQNGLTLASLSNASSAQTLADLRQLTAPFHDVDAAEGAGYNLFKLPPLTAADGCISSFADGGMGYHYTRGDNLADDAVT